MESLCGEIAGGLPPEPRGLPWVSLAIAECLASWQEAMMEFLLILLVTVGQVINVRRNSPGFKYFKGMGNKMVPEC